MSLRKTMAIFLATQFVAVDYAMAAIGDEAVKLNSLTGITPVRADSLLKVGQWYSLNKSVTVGVLEREGSEDNINVKGNILGLVAGTEISIEEVSPDGRFVLIGIDEDLDEPVGEVASEPTLAWVDAALLSRGALSVVNAEAFDIDGLSQFAQDEQPEYVEVEEARRGGGSRVRRRGGRGRKGMTYCLRDVRLTAGRHTSTTNIPRVEMASQAYAAYRAEGWKPVAYSPANPIGTACFQSGGRSCGKGRKCGHASIKIGANSWKGAGVRPTPFLNNSRGKVYHVQGCLTPP